MKKIIQEYNRFFWNYISKYDLTNNNILRKIVHSFSVAEKCYSLACIKNMDFKKRNLSYLIGLFHDLGRFEQWKLYQTYDDQKSEDHGDLSWKLLNQIDCKENFYLNDEEVMIFKESIRFHTKPYLGEDEAVKLFNNILRNCDAYANVITTANGAQQMTVDLDGVTGDILEGFRAQKYLNIYSPRTKLDRSLMLSACCYYVTELELREEIFKFKYIDIIFETFSRYLNEEDKRIYKNLIDELKKNYLR